MAARKKSKNKEWSVRFLSVPCFSSDSNDNENNEKRTSLTWSSKRADYPKSSKKRPMKHPKNTDEAVAYSLYQRFDKKWLQVRSRCKLYLVLWILVLVTVATFVFFVRDITIEKLGLSGTELITDKQISLKNKATFSICNSNYLSITTVNAPTYNLEAYFLCAKSNTPVCDADSDYSRGGTLIAQNISGNFELTVSGRRCATNTILLEVDVVARSSIYSNITVKHVYKSYRTTCAKMGMYYIRYSGFIYASTLTNPRYTIPITVEVNNTCL